MEKLHSLTPIITPHMHSQAEEIYKLMEEAIKENKTSIVYHTQPNKKLHPYIIHLLISKGYLVDDITNILPNGMVSYVAKVNKSYSISIE